MRQTRNWKERVLRNIEFAEGKAVTVVDLKENYIGLSQICKKDGFNYEPEFDSTLERLVKEGMLKRVGKNKIRATHFEGEEL